MLYLGGAHHFVSASWGTERGAGFDFTFGLQM